MTTELAHQQESLGSVPIPSGSKAQALFTTGWGEDSRARSGSPTSGAGQAPPLAGPVSSPVNQVMPKVRILFSWRLTSWQSSAAVGTVTARAEL